MVLATINHGVSPDQRSDNLPAPIHIGKRAWIGSHATILPGVTIGDGAIVAAGAVVTKDVPAGVLAAGNPCKVIREITEEDRRYFYKKEPFDDEVWSVINKDHH